MQEQYGALCESLLSRIIESQVTLYLVIIGFR